MKLTNRTGCLQAEEFIRREAKPFETSGLAVRLKYSRDRDAMMRGYFRIRDARLVAAVNPSAALPTALWFPVRTEAHPGGRLEHGYASEQAATLDELLIWVFFHEFHHFLCHTRQQNGSWQTKANAYGFEMLRKFKGAFGAQDGAAPAPESLAGFREPAMNRP